MGGCCDVHVVSDSLEQRQWGQPPPRGRWLAQKNEVRKHLQSTASQRTRTYVLHSSIHVVSWHHASQTPTTHSWLFPHPYNNNNRTTHHHPLVVRTYRRGFDVQRLCELVRVRVLSELAQGQSAVLIVVKLGWTRTIRKFARTYMHTHILRRLSG